MNMDRDLKSLEIFKDMPIIDINKASRRSNTWYNKMVYALDQKKSISRNAERLIKRGDPATVKTKAKVGFMYLFGYDPKYKDILPIYDRYPLVLPFSADKETFTGFNIHYLPYRIRSIMLERVLYFANNTKYDETTRVKLTWNLVAGWSKLEELSYCVKKYRWDHVKTPFKQIAPKDWGLVALLNLHKFVGGNQLTAWKSVR